jgi:hypothetical protein
MLLVIHFEGKAQENATIAKIEFQMAEESFEKKQYEEAREHIKKVESILKTQSPKTMYLDIICFSEILKINSFVFGRQITQIKTQTNNLKSFIDEANTYLSKYVDISPEEKVKEIYTLKNTAQKQYEIGKNVSIKLEKTKDSLLSSFQTLVVDSNKVYDANFTNKVKLLIEKFQPGDDFREALADIDHPRSAEMKDKMLSMMSKFSFYKNQMNKLENTDRPLSKHFREFLDDFNKKQLAPFNYMCHAGNLDYLRSRYSYKGIPLNYLKLRSTNLVGLKLDKEIQLGRDKLSIYLNTVYTDESGKIIAIYYDLQPTKNIVNDFSTWIGKKSDWGYNLVLDGYKENTFDWYFNQLSIRVSYSEITVNSVVKPKAYLLLTYTDKDVATLANWEYYFLNNKMYFVEFN